MATTIESIQQLYIAFFNRPADAGGLDFWVKSVGAGTSLASIGAQFAAQAEYKAEYGGKSPEATVAQIYQNLFNRLPDAGGLAFWAAGLRAGTYTIDTIVAEVAASAQQDPAKGPDTVAVQSKVAAAVAFTDYLKTDTAALIAYSTGAVNGIAKAYIAGVTDAATLATATTAANLGATGDKLEAGNEVVGQTYNLTTNVDTITGTAGNDTINGNLDGGDNTLSGLDKIDGGAGKDTLNLTAATTNVLDFSLGKVSNVETINITSVGTIKGNGATTADLDLTTFATGVTQVNIDVAQGAGFTVKAATTTGLSVITDADVAITGAGGAVNVEAAGAVTIGAAGANKLTSVSVTGAAGAAITDRSGASAAVGSTLKSVTLSGATAASTITGDGVNAVTIADGEGIASNVTVTNTKAHAMTLTLDGVEQDATPDSTIFKDDTATSLTVVAADDSIIGLDVKAAKTLAVSGAGDIAIDDAVSVFSALTTVTFSGSGALEAVLDGADELVSITTSGSGTLDVTIAGTNNAAAGAAAQSVTGGAGADKVTITGTLGKGSTLNLGGGSDSVLVSGAGVITSEAVVDAGAGTDTLALSIVGGANVGAFKNFENFDVAGITTNFDQEVLNTKNTVSNFTGSAATTDGVTLQNLGAGVGFIVTGNMGTATNLNLTQAAAGALTITSNVDEAKADDASDSSAAKLTATNATTLNVVFDNQNADDLSATVANTARLDITGTKAATVNITSGGSEVVNTANLTSGASSGADVLKTVVVTGSQALVLDVAHGGTVSLTSLDASAHTGGLTFSLADLASAGNLKLGSGDDVITQAAATTVGATSATAQIITGLEFGAEDATEQDGFDVVKFAGADVAADNDATPAVFVIENGVYTFKNAGAATLELAVDAIGTNIGVNKAVIFEFAGSTYLFGSGADAALATDDFLVKLAGVSLANVDGLGSYATGEVFVY